MSYYNDDDTRAVYSEKCEDGHGKSSITNGVRKTATAMKQTFHRSVNSVQMWTWRQWLRPIFVVCYSLVACGALGVMIWDMVTNYSQNQFAAAMWMSAGACSLFAIGVSIYGILSHVVYFSRPNQQRYIVRILLMVPIYCIDVSIALRVPAAAIILDSIRACYQAFVVYCFLFYLLHYLTENYDLDSHLSSKPKMKSPKPFCCFKPGPNSKLVYRCRNGVLNFVIIGPTTTLITLILYYASEDYTSGSFAVTGAWLWVTIVSGLSQIWAMYCLAIFYQATKEETQPLRPLPQMLCVKFAIFGSFFQQVAIALLIDLEVIKYPPEWGYSKSTFASTVHNFCIGFEMAVVSVIHLYAFTHKPYKNDEPMSFRPSCRSLCDYSDMKDDIRVHSGRFLQSIKKRRKDADEIIIGEGDTALQTINTDKSCLGDVMNGTIHSTEDGESKTDEESEEKDRKDEIRLINGELVSQDLEVPDANVEEKNLSGADAFVNTQSVEITDEVQTFTSTETAVLSVPDLAFDSNNQEHQIMSHDKTDLDEFGMSKSFEVTARSDTALWGQDVTNSYLEDAFSDLSYDKEPSIPADVHSSSQQPWNSPTGIVSQSFTDPEHIQSGNPFTGQAKDKLHINLENNTEAALTDQSPFSGVYDVGEDPTNSFRDVSLLNGIEESIPQTRDTSDLDDFSPAQREPTKENNLVAFSGDVDPFAFSSDC